MDLKTWIPNKSLMDIFIFICMMDINHNQHETIPSSFVHVDFLRASIQKYKNIVIF